MNEAFPLDELKVRRVLVCRRDPTVTDQQTLDRPLRASVLGEALVAIVNGLCNIWDVLTGIRFTGEI